MFNCNKLEIFNNNIKLVDMNFTIKSSLALVGESGSGKTLTLKRILNMLPKNLKSKFNYQASFELKRGLNLTFIPQNPFTSLSPMTKIKDQFMMNYDIAKRNMKLVDLDEKLLNRFPMELSGGQLQRVIIAMAIKDDIELMLLDEPTTALDKENQKVVMNLLKNLQHQFNFLILFVTHDINSIRDFCEDIIILNKGYIIESGNLKKVLANPQHQYTKELINSNFSNRGFRK
jgi:peptide/nickel transport system ATP-binding protein